MFARFIFALMGVPIMFTSLFNVIDVFPYGQMSLIYNNNIIELTDEEKADIQSEFSKYLENAYDTPALAVIFPELYKEMLKDGYFLNFKFDAYYDINGLPFNELTIQIIEKGYGFNVFRGLDGVFQGRCFYVNTENVSTSLFECIQKIVDSKNLNFSEDAETEQDDISDINENF